MDILLQQLSRRLLTLGYLLGVIVCLPNVVTAQELLIEFSSEVSSQLTRPSHAQTSEAVRIFPAALEHGSVGDLFKVQISENELADVVIDAIVRFVNGDIGLSARGRGAHADLSFSLTIGEASLFGYIAARDVLWQIAAAAENNGFLGWVFKPLPLNHDSNAPQNDFIIPDQSVPVLRTDSTKAQNSPTMPLLLQQPFISESSIAATNDGITADNFSVTQVFTPSPVIAGAQTSAAITLINTSSEAHTDLSLEIYFLLEDSELVTADPSCVEALSASLQKILRCELGSFQPGEEKVLSVTVQSSADSFAPIASTIVLGSLRNDTAINVVEDVQLDSDFDGISNFNEVILGTDPNDSASVDYSVSEIDVLALYSSGAEYLYPLGVQTRINQLISVANQIYRDSGVGISLRPVHHQWVDYSDSEDMDVALDQLINRSDPAFSDIETLRNVYGADLVILFRPLESDAGRCGLAPIGGFQTNGYFNASIEGQYAVSTVAIDCPLDIAVAHELGHNMGLSHSHLEDGFGGTFNFATGYGVDSQFVTIMASPSAFNNAARVARFSDPGSECLGFSCGVPAGQEFGADAVTALNLVRHQIANYQPTVVPDLPSTSVSAVNGYTNAVISIAASRDSGLSFASQFTPEDRVDLSAVIKVDDRHVGSEGSLHVLVGQEGVERFYQLNQHGDLVEWDGEIDSLIPIDNVRALNSEERLALLNGFRFSWELIGLDLVVYVGYRTVGADDFIYTDSPLVLNIVQSR